MISAAEQTRPDVVEKRKEWEEFMKEANPEKFVFLDESGVNIGLTRTYGRSIGKTRVVDYVPFNRPVRTTVVSSIRLDGQYCYDIIDGSMNKERFKNYIEKLSKTLKPGDIVIMDNLSSHKDKETEEKIKSVGATVKYLPPYSPDFNPIELLWSKMKSYLKKWKIRIKELLPKAIVTAISKFTISDCIGWFKSCGFCYQL